MTGEGPLDIQDCRTYLLFKVHVLPKSSRNAIAGKHLDALKIKITAPPSEGLANRMCIDFLSRQLKTPKSCLFIVSGQTGRTKRIRFTPSAKSDPKFEIKRVKGIVISLAFGKTS